MKKITSKKMGCLLLAGFVAVCFALSLVHILEESQASLEKLLRLMERTSLHYSSEFFFQYVHQLSQFFAYGSS